MNKKIENYINVLFSDVPRSKKAHELREELLANLSDRFEDYLSQGMSENQAYAQAVGSLGDLDEVLGQVMPDANFLQEAGHYRRRNARNIAIGVSLYILGPVFLIGISSLGEWGGQGEFFGTLGVLALLILVAAATGLIVYTNLSTPREYRDYDDQSRRERVLYSGRDGQVLKSILSIYWTFITFVYLAVSFLTMAWNITWIIWVLAAVFGQIITTVFEMRNCND